MGWLHVILGVPLLLIKVDLFTPRYPIPASLRNSGSFDVFHCCLLDLFCIIACVQFLPTEVALYCPRCFMPAFWGGFISFQMFYCLSIRWLFCLFDFLLFSHSQCFTVIHCVALHCLMCPIATHMGGSALFKCSTISNWDGFTSSMVFH